MDESGDCSALSGGIVQWYENTLYIRFASMGQGISAKVFDSDSEANRYDGHVQD